MSTRTALEDAAIILDSPYAKVHIRPVDLADRAIMRARQLAALLMAMQDDQTGPDSLLWMAQQTSDELVVCVEALVRAGGAK
jgi:hypothetical protein